MVMKKQSKRFFSGSTESSVLKVSRRKALIWIAMASIVAMFSQFGIIACSFFKPSRNKNSFGEIVDAGTLTDLPPVNSRPKQFSAGRFWLIHNDNGITALHSSCTHLECLFTWNANKDVFVCPCHGSEFSKTGQLLKGPAERDLDRFPINLITESGTTLLSSNNTFGEPLPIHTIKNSGETNVTEQLQIKVDTGNKFIGNHKG